MVKMKNFFFKIAYFIDRHFKILFLIMSLCGIYLAWRSRYMLFSYLPFNDALPFYNAINTAFNIIYAIVLFFFSLAVLKTIVKPNIFHYCINKRLRQSGLRNGSGEPLTLVSRYTDKKRKDGMCYTVKGRGITVFECTENIDRLRAAFKGQSIYDIKQGRGDRIRIYVQKRQRGKFNVTIHQHEIDGSG
jgi:hypothetical protein